MLKLLLFADSNSIHTKKWIEILQKHFEIHLVSFSSNHIKGVINYSIPVGKINPTGGNYKYLLKLLKIRKIFRSINPDIINAHYTTSYGFIAALLKKKQTKFILSVHGTDVMVTPIKGFLLKLITKFTLNKSDHIFSVAQHMTEKIIEYLNGNKENITTIQYGVDIDQISKFTSPNRKIDFITTRNLIPNSNHEIILKAFKKYINHINHFAILYIVGNGPLKSKMMNFVKENNLTKNIIFTGRISQIKLFKLLGKSKFYISMTSSDGASLSLLEAMVCKNIPIVSDINANREWIKEDENGLLCNIDENHLFNIMVKAKYNILVAEKNYRKVMKNGNFKRNSVIILEKFI